MATTIPNVASWLVRHRWISLIIGLLCLIPLAQVSSQLTMNRSLASLFAADDPTLIDYQMLQETFGGNLVVMVVYDDEDLDSASGLRTNQRWTERAESLAGVRGVLSIAKLSEAFAFLRPTASPTGILDRNDSLARDFLGLFAGYTHNPQRNVAAIVAMLDPDEVTTAVAGLRSLVSEMPPERRAVMVGEPVVLDDAFDLIQADGRWLATLTIALLSFILVISLRDYRCVVLLSVCILWSTLATRSVMVGIGIELSLVSTILVAIITVVVVAAVIHLGVALRDGQTTTTAVSMLGLPILWTCLTDAAGFGSLLVSEVRPVAQFGIMTATAAFAVLIAFICFAPAILHWPSWPRRPNSNPSAQPPTSPMSRRSRWLRSVCRSSMDHRRILAGTAVIALVMSTWAVTRTATKASFLRNFRDDSPIVRAYDRVETRLGGAGVWDVVLPAPQTIDSDYLANVRELEANLRRMEVTDAVSGGTVGLSKVLSLADADEVASRSPLLSLASPEIRLRGMATALPTFAQALLVYDTGSPEKIRRMRIMLRSQEGLSATTKRALSAEVRRIVDAWEQQPTDQSAAPIITGYSVLMSRLVDGLLRDQWRSLLIAMLSVGALLWLATGSPAWALAALIVNALPIMAVLSVMGWLGDGLDLGSAMIGAVSIGLSIDGSVHLMIGVRRRLLAGEDLETAILESATRVSGPILLATVALVVGFAGLGTSRFIPTATFGTLVSATLWVSAVTNLTLLPALLRLVTKPS